MKYISLYFLNPDIEKKIVTYFGEEENVIIKIAIFKKIMLETEFYLPIKSLNDILNLKHHSSIQKKVANINNKAKDLINNILLTYKTNYSRKTMMDINLHNFNEVVKKILGKEDFDLPYPDNEARGLQMSLYLILTNPIIECQLLNLLGIKETNL
ncbi:MAG: hypothetical protein RMJ67_07775, partial [Elusimicrobiota bacterium]|nr:hypothetical protein [Endomicrobiia bacterium]MDW8166391.1 hypothetical protein [Elusimicrobiota bacterium]